MALIAAALACGSGAAALLAASRDIAQIPPVLPHPGLDPAAAAEISAIFDEARSVLMSPAFEANLTEATAGLDLRLSPGGAKISAAQLADMMRGERGGYSYVKATAKWQRFGRSHTEASGPDALIILKRAVRGYWRSGTAAGRSCAVNTAAHELSHTITATAGRPDFSIADRGYTRAGDDEHFASYTIGSVAHCTWLQAHNALSETIGSCVRRIGTRAYHPGSCG